MRKFVVIVTLLYIAAVAAALGYLSDWFREGLAIGESVIATTLVLGVIAAVIVAVIAYWRDNEWLAVVLVMIILGSGWYVGKTHHQAYGEWFPSAFTSAEVETSGSATLNADGQNLTYKLELHNPGTVTHREYLVITRGGKDQRIRIPVFNDARSGYVSPKTPNDWIMLHPTEDADIYRAETGRFLFVKKSFRVNLRTGEVTALATKSLN